MADLRLERPQAGQRVEYSDLADARIVMGFPTDEAVLERQGDSLVFTFDDDSVIVLQDFYNAFTSDTLPEFNIDGQTVSGSDFFAALGDETLMPAAGPAAQAAADGMRYRDYNDLGLYDGIDRLDGLDIGWQWGDEAEDDPWGGRRGGDDEERAPEPENLVPDVQNFLHYVYEDAKGGPDWAAGDSLTGSIQGDGAHSFVWAQQVGEFGTFTMNEDGTYRYDLDSGNDGQLGHEVQSLKEGETREETFSFTYIDEDGDSATGTVTIIITGTNDGVVLAPGQDGADYLTLKESGHGTYQNVGDGGDHGFDSQGSFTHTEGGANQSNEGKVVVRTPLESFTVQDADLGDDQHLGLDLGNAGFANQQCYFMVGDNLVSSLDTVAFDADGKATVGVYDDQGRLIGNLLISKSFDGAHTTTYSYQFEMDDADWMSKDYVFGPKFGFTVRDNSADSADQAHFDLNVKVYGTNDKPELELYKADGSQGPWEIADGNNGADKYAAGVLSGKYEVVDPDDDGQRTESTGNYDGHKFSITHDDGSPNATPSQAVNSSSFDDAASLRVEGNWGYLTFHPNGEYTYTLYDDGAGGYKIDSLGTGQERTEVFHVLTQDKGKATDTGDIVIKITGSDNPTDISVVNGDNHMVLKESGYGTTVSAGLNADGRYENVDAAADAYTGGITTDSIKFQVNDVDGNDTVTCEVVLKSSNVSGVTLTPQANGVYLVHDSTGLLIGTLKVTGPGTADGTGQYSVSFEINQVTVNPLTPDDQFNLDFDFKVTTTHRHDNGTTSTTVSDGNDFKVDILGTNDKPWASVSQKTLQDDGLNTRPVNIANESNTGIENAGLLTTGTVSLSFGDVDRGDTLTVSLNETMTATNGGAGVSAIPSANFGTPTLNTTQTPGVYQVMGPNGEVIGTLTFNASAGTYSFVLDPTTDFINQFGPGQGFVLKFPYTVTDSYGASTTQNIEITIKGTNDAPVLTNTLNTDTDVTAGTADLTVSGQLSQTDVDLNNTGFTYRAECATDDFTADPAKSLTHGTSSSPLDAITIAGKYGDLTLYPDGSYTYTIVPGRAATQALGDGMSGEEVFEFQVHDSHGAVSEVKNINITVNGADDPSKIDLVGGDGTAATIMEEGYYPGGDGYNTPVAVESKPVTGGFALSDPDANDNPVCVIKVGTTEYPLTTDASYYDSDTGEWTIPTEYGTLVLKAGADGSYTYTYTVDNDNAAIDGLRPGERENDDFTIIARNDDKADIEQNVSMTIQGTNDRPTISLDANVAYKNAEGTVVRSGDSGEITVVDGDTWATANGSLTPSDVDAPQKNGADDYSGYRYSLVPCKEEDGTITEIGPKQNVIEGKYGFLELDPMTGDYVYHLYDKQETRDALKALGKGETLEDVFYAKVTDDLGLDSEPTPIKVTLVGKDDPFSVTGNSANLFEDGVIEYIEGGQAPSCAGQLVVHDIDTNDKVLGFGERDGDVLGSGESVRIDGTYGYLTLNADGSYTYTMTEAGKALYDKDYLDSLNAGRGAPCESFNVNMRQELADTTVENNTINITINIAGQNDAPKFTQEIYKVGDAGRLQAYVVTGKVLATDIDDAYLAANGGVVAPETAPGQSESRLEFDFAQGSDTQVMGKGAYGTFVIDPVTGEYQYILDVNSKAYRELSGKGDTTDTIDVYVRDPQGGEHVAKIEVVIKDPKGTGPGGVGIDKADAEDLVTKEDAFREQHPDNEDYDDVANDGQITVSGQISNGMDTNGQPIAIEAGGPYSFVLPNGDLSQFMTNEYGTFYIDAKTGKYTFILDNDSDAVQNLPEGTTITFPATVGTIGNNSVANINVTIKGTNDVPTVGSSTQTLIQSNTSATVTGALPITDRDLDTSNSVNDSVAAPDEHEVFIKHPKTGELVKSYTDADGNTIALVKDGQGNWSYKFTLAPDSDLSAADLEQHQYEIVVRDYRPGASHNPADNAHMSESGGTITINVTGTNTVVIKDTDVFEDGSDGNGTSMIVAETERDGVKSVAIEAVDDHGSVEATGSIIVKGEYGSLIYDTATGQFRYVLDNENPNVQAFNENQAGTDRFVVKVTDKNGTVIEKEINVEVKGTADEPDLYLIGEDGKPSSVLILTEGVDDAPDTDVHSVSMLTLDKDAGDTTSYTICADGQTWLDVNSSNFPLKLYDEHGKNYATLELVGGTIKLVLGKDGGKLGSGDFFETTVQVKVTDSTGLTDVKDLDIKVVGTNNAPEISGAVDGKIVADDNAETGNTSVTGNIGASDPEGGALSYEFEGSVLGKTGQYGSITIDNNGNYVYTLNENSNAFKDLAGGRVVEETFKVIVRDPQGAEVEVELVVKVEGSNDAPVLRAHSNALTDNGNVTLSASGRIIADDRDVHEDGSKDTLTYEVVGSNQGTLGTLTLNANGTYTYTIDSANRGIVTNMGQGEYVTETFRVKVSDGNGGFDERDITIKVNGRNEAPTINVTKVGDGLTEDAGGSITGTIAIDDIDGKWTLGDLHGTSDTLILKCGTATVGTGTTTVQGSWGTLLIVKQIDGSFTYEYSLNGKAQALADGQQVEEKFTFTVSDGKGGSASSTVTIPVTGANDAPTITLPTESAALDIVVPVPTDPAAASELSGSVVINDVDANDVLAITVTSDLTNNSDNASGGKTVSGFPITIDGEYGTLTYNADGSYTYELNTEHDAVKYLDKDASALKESFTFTASDGTVTESKVLELNISSEHDVVKANQSHIAQAGGDTDHKLFGEDGADNMIYGAGGDDILFGGNGNDFLHGGTGENQLYGGDGHDILVFNAQNTVMDGGDGIDFLVGVSDTNSLESLLNSGAVKDVEVAIIRGGGSLTSLEALDDFGLTVKDNGFIDVGNGWTMDAVETAGLGGSLGGENGFVAFTKDGTDEMILVQKTMLENYQG